ncbi:MAG: lipocalin-like domain-containing protein [Tannerellaceae bacterium]|jgi:hypothetical protein|nr:lipocalin-like domain-containing protein [Tannerellaceae bacterium]
MKKKILYYLLLLMLFASCNKAFINGKLDGMWQLMEIDKSEGERIDAKADRIYYSVQLQLISLRQAGKGQFIGRFVHRGDSLWIHDLRIYGVKEEDKLATKEHLAPFGFNGISERFAVEELSRSRMVLRSEYATLSFRKF